MTGPHPASAGSDTDLLDRLRGIVGADDVLVDDDRRAGYEIDWTGRYGGRSLAVVRPASTAEVAAVVVACRHHGAAIIPQGGNTGLVGGGVPRPLPRQRAQIVVSTRRLDRLDPVDAEALAVVAGAGVTLGRLSAHAAAAGLDIGVDFAARDSATVGGAIATNAGGSRVIRYGTMRAQVLGLEVVLGTGEIIGSLDGLPKETAGIHLGSLLAGSEGTLGIITAARVRLVPRHRHTVTALVALPDVSAAVDLMARLRTGIAGLDSVEIIGPAAMAVVTAHLGGTPTVEPTRAGIDLDAATWVLVECSDHDDPTDRLITVLATAPDLLATAVSTDGPGRSRLMAVRDRITEAINALGVPYKLDVAVPPRRLVDLLAVAESAAERHGARLYAFGHLAEGNLHLNHLPAGSSPIDTVGLADEVLGAVAAMGGTISAEHGIGTAKVDWLGLIRSDADRAAAAAVRAALDPDRLMNPGVLAPAE